MRVLITGGAGFIGSHLVRGLLARGDQVIVLDDFSTGRIENIEPFLSSSGFDYRVGSATDLPLVSDLVDSCDLTVHLAAAVGVRLIVENSVHTIETNVGATETVLRAVTRRRQRTLVASTSEVYGKSEKAPFSEDDDLCLGPTKNSRWAYACSKALDEWLALAYWREKQVPTTIVRLFNTVGPRQTGRYGMVLPSFAAQALRGVPIEVYGSGRQSRSFCHVQDTVKALLLLVEDDASIGEVVNVGNDREVTIAQLADMVRTAAKSRSQIRHVPYDEAYAEGFEDIMRRVPDLSKLERLTGFRPDTPLERIIEDVLEDQRSRRE